MFVAVCVHAFVCDNVCLIAASVAVITLGCKHDQSTSDIIYYSPICWIIEKTLSPYKQIKVALWLMTAFKNNNPANQFILIPLSEEEFMAYSSMMNVSVTVNIKVSD